MVTNKLNAPFPDRSMSIQSVSVERLFQTAFVEEFELVGILRVKVVNKYLCISHVLYGKSPLSETVNFFPGVFQT